MTNTINDYRVYLGGDVDIESMAIDSNIADVVATNEVGWYIQESDYYGMIANGDIASINKNFGYSNIEVEINLQYSGNIASWVKNTYIPDWIDQNLNITEWNSIINFADGNWYSNFIATVDAIKPYGVTSIAPIYSPNINEGIDGTTSDDFINSDTYAQLRKAALYGGGLTLDTPPWYAYIDGGSKYYQFSSEEIQWANDNNIRSTVIVSPSGDGFFFLGDTIRFIHTIESLGYVPKEWVVENYGSDSDTIGTTLSPNSLSSVAKYIAKEAETTTYTPTPTLGAIQSGMTVNNADTLTLYVSEDAYKGDAQYNITIDGITYKTGLTATASHSDGQTTTIEIKGNFSSGIHDMNIWYSNDASDSGGDRNLYIDKVMLNDNEISSLQSLPGEFFYDTIIYGDNNTESFDTENTKNTLTGISSANDKVNLYYSLVGSTQYTLLGQTTADANGNWSYSFNNLSIGAYNIKEQSIGVNGVTSDLSDATILNILSPSTSSVLNVKDNLNLTLVENTYLNYNIDENVTNTINLNGYNLYGTLKSEDTVNINSSIGNLNLSNGHINANGVYSGLFINSSIVTLYGESTGYGNISNSSGNINLTLQSSSNFSISDSKNVNITSNNGALNLNNTDTILNGSVSYLSLQNSNNSNIHIATSGYTNIDSINGDIGITANDNSNTIINNSNVYVTMNSSDLTLQSGTVTINSGLGNSYITENNGSLFFNSETNSNNTFTINEGNADIKYNKGYTATDINTLNSNNVTISNFSKDNGLIVLSNIADTKKVIITSDNDNTYITYNKSQTILSGITPDHITLLSSIGGQDTSSLYGNGSLVIGHI